MKEFVRFDAELFLKQSKRWNEEKENLNSAIDAISFIHRQTNTPGGELSHINDPVGLLAVKREKILNRLKIIKKYEQFLEEILAQMPPELREVIDVFFFEKGYTPLKIERYGSKYGLCRSGVYAARSKAINLFSKIAQEKCK